MKTFLFILLFSMLSLFIFNDLSAQGVSINEDGAEADGSAMLDIQSSSKGFLIPRLTASEIQAIQQPADGLQVYNTDEGKLYIFVALEASWREVNFGAGSLLPNYTCGDPLYDYRDGQSYATVEINGQCWMAENLNIGTFSTSGQSDDGIINKSCYSNTPSNCDIYGGLYTWNEVMNYSTIEGSQGICPVGWHIPSDGEWYALENFLDPYINNPSALYWRGVDAGGKLKETGYTHWNGPNTGATNSSGMTVLGSGLRTSGGGFSGLKIFAMFMTSTEYYSGAANAWGREIDYNQQKSYRNAPSKYYYYSVRCVKD